MELKTTVIVTVTVLWVGLPLEIRFVEAADSEGMSQSDKSRQPGLPDPGMKQRPPSADPTDLPSSDPGIGKEPTRTPGPGPTAPGSGAGMGRSGGGMGSSGSGSSSGGSGGAAGGGGGR